MKKLGMFFIVFLCLTAGFYACTTSKTVVSNSADLNKYEFASITDVMNYSGSASLMDLEVRVFNALESTRLTMVGENRINELTQEQKDKLLLVKFSATSNEDESVVSVNFVDYMSGKPVASCRGAYGLGFGRQQDMNGAINRVIDQVSKLWNNN